MVTPYYLVQCCAQKADTARPARELYTSDWFVKAREFVGDNPWHILSAKFGVVHPDSTLPPYDCTLASLGQRMRDAWGDRACSALDSILAHHTGPVVFLAGKEYREPIIGTPHQRDIRWQFDRHPWLARVEVPMAGLGIGQQKRWMMDQIGALK